MFVYFTDNENVKKYLNVNHILGIIPNGFFYANDLQPCQITPSQYDEIMQQLEALGLLYKPNVPSPAVGEPLREIVGDAFQGKEANPVVKKNGQS